MSIETFSTPSSETTKVLTAKIDLELLQVVHEVVILVRWRVFKFRGQKRVAKRLQPPIKFQTPARYDTPETRGQQSKLRLRFITSPLLLS